MTWTKQVPAVTNFTATDDANAQWMLSVTRDNLNNVSTASLSKDGQNRGALTGPDNIFLKELFQQVGAAM